VTIEKLLLPSLEPINFCVGVALIRYRRIKPVRKESQFEKLRWNGREERKDTPKKSDLKYFK